MKTIRNYLDRKGQGIVEYAMLLSFIVGLAMMLNGANLSGSVKGVFDDVAALLSGEKKTYADYYKAWSKLSAAELAKIDNAQRVQADREGLVNIGKRFFHENGEGLTKLEIMALLDSSQVLPENKYFPDTTALTEKSTTHLNEAGEVIRDGTNFGAKAPITVLWYNNTDEGGYDTVSKDRYYNSNFGGNPTYMGEETYKSLHPNWDYSYDNSWALNYMQGNYNNLGYASDPNAIKWDSSNSTRYLYSDFMIGNNVAEGKYDSGRTNIHTSFTFDGDGDDAKVTSVRVYTTRSNQIGKDLDVTVTKDGYTTTKVAADVAARYSKY